MAVNTLTLEDGQGDDQIIAYALTLIGGRTSIDIPVNYPARPAMFLDASTVLVTVGADGRILAAVPAD